MVQTSKRTILRTLHLPLVSPHLVYATQIWAPQSIELIVRLERIQRRATKFILKLPYSPIISYVSFTNSKPNTYLLLA